MLSHQKPSYTFHHIRDIGQPKPLITIRRIALFYLIGAPILFGFAMLILFGIGCALGQEKRQYGGPDIHEYYLSLMQPDQQISCCGPGDAYKADTVEPCGPEHGGPDTCALVAVITDTGPNTFKGSMGQTITRVPIPVGTKVVIPPWKVRKVPSANPTDHNIVFLGTSMFSEEYDHTLRVYCWEPIGGM